MAELLFQVWPVPIPIPYPVPIEPVTQGWPDWLKILLTALASFAVGILLEPIRANFNFHIVKGRSLRAIAREVNGIAFTAKMHILAEPMSENREIPYRSSLNFETRAFGRTFEKHPEIIFAIPMWTLLSSLYELADEYSKKDRLTESDRDYLLMQFSQFYDRVKNGLLGPEMIQVLVFGKFSALRELAEEHERRWRERTNQNESQV